MPESRSIIHMQGGSWVAVDESVDGVIAKLTPTARWVAFTDRGQKCYVRSTDAVAVRASALRFDAAGNLIDH